MFRILQYSSSVQDVYKFVTVYKVDNKEMLIINCINNTIIHNT